MKLLTFPTSNPTKQEMISAGFRNEEKPIELLDVKPPQDRSFNINQNTRLGFRIINDDSAKKINDKAIELGLIQKPLPMPYIKKQRPEVVRWKPIAQHFISPSMRHLSGLFVLEMIDGKILAYPDNQKEAFDIDNYLTIKDTEKLFEHLTSGHLAYMAVSGVSPTWITVPELNALMQYREIERDCSKLIESWRELKFGIEREEARLRTVEQHTYLESLPFNWYTDVKQVLSGFSVNSNGCGMKKNTVEHIRLNDDFKKGRFSRKKHDYLCSPKKVANWSDQEQYDKSEVTCKACLIRAKALIKSS